MEMARGHLEPERVGGCTARSGCFVNSPKLELTKGQENSMSSITWSAPPKN